MPISFEVTIGSVQCADCGFELGATVQYIDTDADTNKRVLKVNVCNSCVVAHAKKATRDNIRAFQEDVEGLAERVRKTLGTEIKGE